MHKKCICSQRNVQSKLAERAEIPLLWLPLDKCSNTDVKLRVPRYFMRKSFFFPLHQHQLVFTPAMVGSCLMVCQWDPYFTGTEFLYCAAIIIHPSVQIRLVMSCLYLRGGQNEEHFYQGHPRHHNRALEALSSIVEEKTTQELSLLRCRTCRITPQLSKTSLS